MKENFSHSNAELLLKVEILYSILRNEGYQLSAETYSTLLFTTARLKAQTLGEIAYKLCPIVATNEKEQIRFHEIISIIDKKSLDEIISFVPKIEPIVTPKPPVKCRISKRSYPLIIELALVLVACCYFILRDKPKIELLQINSLNIVQTGDTLTLNGAEWLPENTDTSKIDFSWDFGQNKVVHGLRASHVFTKADSGIVRIEANSDYYLINNKVDTAYVQVCDKIPHITGFKIEPKSQTGVLTKISIVTDNSATGYEWNVDDSISINTYEPFFNYVFNKTGYHRISIVAVNGSKGCEATADTTIETLDPKQKYSVSVSGTTTMPHLEMQARKWVPWLSWVVALIFLSLLLFVRKKSEKIVFLPEYGEPKKNIFEVPFRMNDTGIIHAGKELYKTFHLMRRRADEQLAQLDIPSTLKRTIRNLGLSELVFTPRKKFQEYLLLIDMSDPNGGFRYLAKFLSHLMVKMDVRLNVYYSYKHSYFENLQSGTRVTPEQLVNNHPNALLILIGNGDNLFNFLLPIMKEKYIALFSAWEKRAIITPLSRSDWGYQELVLAKHFLISSADEQEILQLIQRIHLIPEQQRDSEIANNVKKQEFQSIEDAFRYLKDKDFMVQWLCALAVYPKYRWELMLAFGKVLAVKYKIDQGVSYTDLLTLCRISWIAEGSIPSAIRLELLKKLDIENEIMVRCVLLKMLEQARLSGEGYYYDSELDDQLIINKFILYVYDPKTFSGYKQEVNKFKELWEKGQLLDPSLRLYLENSENKKWQTPVQVSKKTITLKKYFDSPKTLNIISRCIAAAFILLATYNVNKFTDSMHNSDSKLAGIFLTPTSNQLVEINYKLIKNKGQCSETDSTFVNDLTGYFNIATMQYRISYDAKNQSITAKIPYEVAVKQVNSGMALTMDSGNPSYVENNIKIDTIFTNGTLTFSCQASTPPNPEVLPYVVLPDTVDDIWSGGSSNRFISIDLNKKVIYYSVGDVTTYGSYSINQVYRTNNAGYKIITRTNEGYRLFFIKNIKPGSFELSVCQDFAKTKEELLNKDESYCDHFNTMRLYYEKDPAKIWYPASNKKIELAKSERNKLNALLIGNSDYNVTRYYGMRQFNKDLSGAVIASLGLKWMVENPQKIVNPSPFQRDYDMIKSVSKSNRILWVDDYAKENNQPEIDYFRKNNIQVDLVKTNEEAYQKLNEEIYSYIITDIGRTNPEPCVADKDNAGVEFVQKVKFPKQFVLVYSPIGTIERNKDQLLKSDIPNANLMSNPEEVTRMILSQISKGNTRKYVQKTCVESSDNQSTNGNNGKVIPNPKNNNSLDREETSEVIQESNRADTLKYWINEHQFVWINNLRISVLDLSIITKSVGIEICGIVGIEKCVKTIGPTKIVKGRPQIFDEMNYQYTIELHDISLSRQAAQISLKKRAKFVK